MDLNPLAILRKILGTDRIQRVTGEEMLEALREATKDKPLIVEIRFPGAREDK